MTTLNPMSIVRVVPSGAARAPERNTPMTMIRLFDAEVLSLDGIHVDEFDSGAEVDAPVVMAVALVEQGRAEYVGEEPALPLAPDAPAAPAEADAAASEDGEEGAGTPVAPGGPEDDLQRPDVDAPRKDLDAFAASLGIAGVAKLPNKAAVNAAIDAALGDA